MDHFPSKLLLFGEHVLLLGNTALAMPMSAFSGQWADNQSGSDRELREKLLQFAQSSHLKETPGLDADAFVNDLNQGLGFVSDIPMGYGLGSSGALCAAVYDRYCRDKTSDLAALKGIFAQMECFFHGASSGIDPLTSYVGKPLLIRNKNEVAVAVEPEWPERPIVFLLDSALPRQTGPLVRWFLEQAERQEFRQFLDLQFLPAHENMVHAWLHANSAEFWTNLQLVSRYQFERFTPMIPATMADLWRQSIDNEDFTLKICGAGGGGFMLGFARSINTVNALAQHFQMVLP